MQQLGFQVRLISLVDYNTKRDSLLRKTEPVAERVRMSMWLELLGLVVLGFLVVILIARSLGTQQATTNMTEASPQEVE